MDASFASLVGEVWGSLGERRFLSWVFPLTSIPALASDATIAPMPVPIASVVPIVVTILRIAASPPVVDRTVAWVATSLSMGYSRSGGHSDHRPACGDH